MEKIAVRCKTLQETEDVRLKVIKEGIFNFSVKASEMLLRYPDDLCLGDMGYCKQYWWVESGYKIISAEEYLKGGGDVTFKVGDEIEVTTPHYDYDVGYRSKIKSINYSGNRNWVWGKPDKGKVFHKDKIKLIKIETKPTIKKENEMKRVRVILINRADDAVIYDHEVKTELSDADLKVQVMLEKSGDIKKACKDVTLLHWEIKTITSYDKPEVK